jgi:hypothetical protein
MSQGRPHPASHGERSGDARLIEPMFGHRRSARRAAPALLLVLAALFVAAAAAEARPHVYKVPGGGKLIVPKTSITDGARVVVRRAKGPRVAADSHPLGRPVSLKMRRGRLVGPVRLILPLRGQVKTHGMPYKWTVRLAYYNARHRRWDTVPAKINRRRRTISARLTHFSWYNPLSWDWGSIILRLDQRIGELRGARTGPAPCTSGVPVPSWADTVTNNGADLQLRTCAEGEGEKVVVQIVNNRPFGMVLRYGAPVAWGVEQRPRRCHGKCHRRNDGLARRTERAVPPAAQARKRWRAEG